MGLTDDDFSTGKDSLDKEEKELVYKDNKTFVNLFNLFFG